MQQVINGGNSSITIDTIPVYCQIADEINVERTISIDQSYNVIYAEIDHNVTIRFFDIDYPVNMTELTQLTIGEHVATVVDQDALIWSDDLLLSIDTCIVAADNISVDLVRNGTVPPLMEGLVQLEHDKSRFNMSVFAIEDATQLTLSCNIKVAHVPGVDNSTEVKQTQVPFTNHHLDFDHSCRRHCQ